MIRITGNQSSALTTSQIPENSQEHIRKYFLSHLYFYHQSISEIEEKRTLGACGNQEVTIKCEFQTIDIISASVTSDPAQCTVGSPNADLADQCCSDEGARLAVDRHCQGKETCIFEVSAEFIGEPCIDETKYLNVEYHCTDTEEPEAEVCFIGPIPLDSPFIELEITYTVIVFFHHTNKFEGEGSATFGNT